jgi:hypothetical protein
VTSSDGKLSIVIPAGALANSTAITIGAAATPIPGAGGAPQYVQYQPQGGAFTSSAQYVSFTSPGSSGYTNYNALTGFVLHANGAFGNALCSEQHVTACCTYSCCDNSTGP